MNVIPEEEFQSFFPNSNLKRPTAVLFRWKFRAGTFEREIQDIVTADYMMLA